jgi:hypothetical protein
MLEIILPTYKCPVCNKSVFIAPYEKDAFYSGKSDTLCITCGCRFLITGEITRGSNVTNEPRSGSK